MNPGCARELLERSREDDGQLKAEARAGTASTSSCIDMLGGESPACTRNTPPGFWAKPAWLADIATSDDEEAIPCQAGGISRRRQKYAWTVPRAILPRRFPRHKISRWAHDGS